MCRGLPRRHFRSANSGGIQRRRNGRVLPRWRTSAYNALGFLTSRRCKAASQGLLRSGARLLPRRPAFTRPLVELHHLQTFVAAAESQSFTRAAKTLAMTQAAVSQHIAALEKELGSALFRRAGRNMIPTDAGHRLYDRARKILDLVEEARRDVGKPPASVRGMLRIASCTVPPESILPDMLARFRSVYPDVYECVTVSDSFAAVQAVESGAADVGIVVETPEGSRLRAKPVACVDMVLVVPRGHPFASRTAIKAEELRGERFLMREPGSGCRRWAERALQSLGIAPGDLTIAVEMNSAEMIRAAVEQGVGIAFLPRCATQPAIAAGHVVPVEVEGVDTHLVLYLITDPRRLPTAPVRAFLGCV